MTWPTVAVTTNNTDAAADSPALARADILDALTKLNQMMAHVSSFAATLLDDTTEAAARATLGAAASGANSDITSLAGLTTALSIAQGGTGATTAASAFTAIKQGATATATGVVELATDAEAQAGTDATRAVTPDNLGAVVIGMGQTWQNLTASRALSTTYTNTTGRTIAIAIKATVNASQSFSISVGGVDVAYSQGMNGIAIADTAYAVVPPGASYLCTFVGLTPGGLYWAELR